MRLPVVIATALAVSAVSSQSPGPPPSVVILNARVFTGVSTAPWAEAVAITDERISFVGSTAEARARAGHATRIVDAGGRLVIPGVNDAHAHVGANPPWTWLDGPPAMEHDPSLEEVTARIRRAVDHTPAGTWIAGEVGAQVMDDANSTRFALDRAAPDHPVMLASWTGHGSLFNTRALRLLGVEGDTPEDPPGGFYVRAPGSRVASGVVHEYAQYALHRRMNALAGPDRNAAALADFAREALALGVTSVQLMSVSMSAADTMTAAVRLEALPRLRVIDFPLTSMTDWQAAPRSDAAAGLARRSGAKWVIDGTPIERLMFLRAPYADRPSTRGAPNFTRDELAAFLSGARAAGEQPMLHAVGDAAIDLVLDALEASGGDAWRPLRPRLEHGDMLEPAHFDRAKKLGLILVQNPSHMMLAADGAARLGPRASRVWLVRQAAEAGVPLALGSDGPMSPWLNVMFATISAGNPAGALTREQALVAYTSGAAYAEFAEDSKGRLMPGMLADLAILSQDIFTVPTADLPKTVSVLTMVGGRVVHAAAGIIRALPE